MSKKKSVVIIGTRGYPSYYGGFETAVRTLAPYLADSGWDVTVYGRPGSAVLSDLSLDPRVKSVITRGVDTKSLSTLSYGLSACLHAFRRKPDVALVMNVANGYFLPLLRARRIPTLVNVDGIEWDRAKWGVLAKAVFYNGAKWTARHGTRLVYDAKAISTRWFAEFGTDGEFIPYGAESRPSVAVEEGLEHRGYVLVVARFVPENTIPQFLDALEVLDPSIPVIIVGSSGYGGDLEERVRTIASSRSNIRWLGHVSDDERLIGLWEHAGVYFHGHSVGGTNPALVQAMAAGAPVLARDTVFNREVLGDHGIFVEATGTSIAKGIETIIRNISLLEELSSANRLRSNKHYSWGLVCRAYERALDSLAFPNSDSATEASSGHPPERPVEHLTPPPI